MIRDDLTIITNNPLVRRCMGARFCVAYLEGGHRDVLVRARDLVYLGHELLTHPLAGSVKPGETPYRSVAVSEKPGLFSAEQAELAGSAVLTFDQFAEKNRTLSDKLMGDLQLIDYTLIASALDFDAAAGLVNIEND